MHTAYVLGDHFRDKTIYTIELKTYNTLKDSKENAKYIAILFGEQAL